MLTSEGKSTSNNEASMSPFQPKHRRFHSDHLIIDPGLAVASDFCIWVQGNRNWWRWEIWLCD